MPTPKKKRQYQVFFQLLQYGNEVVTAVSERAARAQVNRIGRAGKLHQKGRATALNIEPLDDYGVHITEVADIT